MAQDPQPEEILAELIKINSVNPPGNETAVAAYLKKLFEEHGVRSEIIEPAPGRGSLLATLGEGEKRLLYLGHTDVVPVGDDWTFEPFAGEIRDGFVHGRGALDCKGLVAAQAWAAIELARQDKLDGRLIFAATADEEVGSNFGVRYLIEKHLDKITADFCLTEGGEEPVVIGGKTCHFIGTGEKGPLWVKLRARGVAAHGSLPLLGDNAIVKMADAVRAIAAYKSPVKLIPEVKRLVDAVGRLTGFKTDINERNIDELIKKLEDKPFAAYLHAITRMTVSPNIISAGTAGNIVPDSAEAEVDIRVLPGQSRDFVLGELQRLSGGCETEIVQYNPASFSGADSSSFRLIESALAELVPGCPVLPTISSGATDARFLRAAGIPCYGINMLTLDTSAALKQSIHGKDEKLDIASLRLKARFLLELARRYLG